MKVDAEKIRAERVKRAWTQQRLATPASLGLRTIQRIERTGNASFETVQALAAVLSLSIAELRADDPARAAGTSPAPKSQSKRLRASPLGRLEWGLALGRWLERGLPLGLGLKLLLAAVSAAACGLFLESRPRWIPSLLDILAVGALFGAMVLWPNLALGRRLPARALGLLAVGVLSFTCAIFVLLEVTPRLGFDSALGPWRLESWVLASAAGAGIVLVGARSLLPLRATQAYWISGAATSVAGGILFYVTDSYGGGPLAVATIFAAWHVLVCLAIEVGRRTRGASPAAARNGVARRTVHPLTVRSGRRVSDRALYA